MICACGCGAEVRSKWLKGHNRRGVSPTNKKGPFIISRGRAFIYKPNHHRAIRSNGYTPRAVVALENKLGRELQPRENVHHIDGNKLNDSPENLEALSHAAHTRHHIRVSEICLIEGCQNPHKARGLCGPHYNRFEHFNLTMPLPPTRGNRWSSRKEAP